MDMDILEFSDILTLLDPDSDYTIQNDVWGSLYQSQKQHMVLWCRDQVNARGKGPYSRTVSNHSARTMYNRFANPGGLLWMAEALGEDEATLDRAIRATLAEEAAKNKRGRCNAFRRIIPWERIAELLANPLGWLYDPALLPFDALDKDGFPLVSDDWCETYKTVMHHELEMCLPNKP